MSTLGVRARLAITAVVVLACARSLPPPGGTPDRLPPQIIATTPEPLSVVEGFEGPVVFRFDERISERGIEGSVLVSPETGEVRVSKGGSELRIDLEGGWQPGIVYSVLLAPGLRDLFNNERRDPVDLVFSTGPAIMNTAFGGLVSERITGRPATQAIVEATRRADSLRYKTTADSLAFFAFRNLPLGLYDVVAYADQNRNRRRDPSEAASLSTPVSLNNERDTTDLDLAVVPQDTTPPRLLRAEGRDSLQVRLFSDDYIDPDIALENFQVRLLSLPDSEVVGGALTLMKVDSFTALERVRAEQARADSLARDTTAARDTTVSDTAAAAAPTPLRPTPSPQAGQPARPTTPGGGLPPVGPLPYQEIVLIAAEPLAPGEYLVELGGLVNISGRRYGGGTAEFEISPPRAPPDTSRMRPDTSGVPPDTGRVRRDPTLPERRTGSRSR